MLTTNKVFSVLLALNRPDRRRLTKFMNSPYFTQSRPLNLLCAYFLEKIELGANRFDKNEAFSTLFPNEKYDDVNFRKYCSDLLGLVEVFLANERFNQNSINKKIATCEAIKEKNIEPLFETSFRDVKKEISKAREASSDFFYSVYLVEKNFYELLEIENKGIERFNNIEELMRNLDTFYFIEKIKYYSSILSQKNLLNQDYKVDFIEPILSFLKTWDTSQFPVLSIYYNAYLTLSEPSEITHYFSLKNQLIKSFSQLKLKEALIFFDSAMNYCVNKMNQGFTNFSGEYFELAEIGIKSQVLFEGGELMHWRFNNIVANALRLGKVEWANSFVDEYSKFVIESHRENVVSFSLSRIYWYQKKYEKVLEVIRNVEYEDFNYSLISKSTILKAYYELDEIEALLSFLETFTVYINRHKEIPTQRRKNYLNLIRYTKKLTLLNKQDKVAIQKLKAEISATKEITNADWLLEKLEELHP